MTIREVVSSYKRLETRIAETKGDFALFALFQLEEVQDSLDLLVSAPWVEADREAALNYFVEEIKSFLGPEHLIPLSRIVFVDPNNRALQDLNREINVEHGTAEIIDTNIFGLHIKHAYIITSKLLSAPVAG